MADRKTRALFEEAGAKADAPRAAPVKGAAEAQKRAARRSLSLWQFALAGLVAIMVLVGGLTRLTDSGLSITEWNLVSGVLPPFSPEGWQAEFAKYQQIPEFKEQNFDMGLAEFKTIYWWEWGHRFLGRIIGLAFIIPFALFLMRKAIPVGWTSRLLIPGVLIGVQGVIGWWMVSSGLVGRLDVAPYRLALHLGLAFLIFALLLWNGLALARPDRDLLTARRRRKSRLMGFAGAATALTFVQILSGALVAGLDAGRGYTDWPLMDGVILPPEAFEMTPFWRNIFENPALAQFDHRIIGYILFAVLLLFWRKCAASGHTGVKTWGSWVAVAALGQTMWGVITVMNGAPLGYAIMHQFGALVLVFLLIRTKFEIAYPKSEKIAGA